MFTVVRGDDRVIVQIDAAAIKKYIGSAMMRRAQCVTFVRSNMPRIVCRAINKRDRYGRGAADRVQLEIGELEIDEASD